MMKRKSEIEGSLTRLDKENERSFHFIESKSIQVRNLKGSFAFREMMTGAIYSALQHYGNAVFIMWITGIYEVKSEVYSYEYVQEKIDSGKWELMVNLQTVTATDEFFRGEAKKLAKENMELRHKEGEK
nr:hypothetical protein [Carnobacterium maltaromaticum]